MRILFVFLLIVIGVGVVPSRNNNALFFERNIDKSKAEIDVPFDLAIIGESFLSDTKQSADFMVGLNCGVLTCSTLKSIDPICNEEFLIRFSIDDPHAFIIELRDIIGRKIKSSHINVLSKTFTYCMDINNVPQGRYILVIKDNQNKYAGFISL